MENGKIAILLDKFSRAQIKTSLSELSNAGFIFLKEIEDLAFIADTDKMTVILLGDVLENLGILSKLKVYKSLLRLEYLYMGQSTDAVELLKDFSRIYVCDYTCLELKMITAALVKDKAFQKELRDEILMRSKADALLTSDEISEEVKEVLEEFKVLQGKYKELQNKEQSVEKQLNQLHRKLDIVIEMKNRFSKGYQKIIKSAYDLNETLREYEGVLTTDVYEKVDVYKYPNRPFILYFKVFESLMSQELFFSVLYEVIQKQLHKSVKIVNLYDSRTCRQMKTLSDNYHRIYNSVSINDTLPGLIAKTGDYLELFDILLTNKVGLDFLIVVDQKSIEDTIMLGQDLSFNICENKKHLTAYKLSSKNTIVFGEEDENGLNFGNVENEIKDLSKEDTFLKLSSLNVFQQIVSSIKMQRSV